MDDPALDPVEHRRALAGLARINRWSGSDHLLWPIIRREALAIGNRPLRVLDVATGSGDVLVALARRAARAGIRLQLAGCDISPTAVAAATAAAEAAGANIHFFQHNVLSQPLPAGYDVVVTSLFLHHLSQPEAVYLLREMGRASDRLVIVNDLHRSRINIALVWLACHVLSRSRIVWHDGPASVRAAFTPGEARELATSAALSDARVVPKLGCRWLLTWRKQG